MTAPAQILDAQLRAAGVPILGVGPDAGGGWRVDYGPSATAAQQAQGAQLAAAFDGALAAAKADAAAALDARTAALLAAGFAWDGAQFALDGASQLTWTGMAYAAGLGLLTYPQAVQALDLSLHALADVTAVGAFWATGMARVKALMEGASGLKAQVQAAADLAGVLAIQDTRA